MEKSRRENIAPLLLGLALLMLALQLARIGIKELFFLAVPRDDFTDRIASALAMSLLAAGTVLLAAWRKTPLSVFPPRFSWPYIAATAAAAAFFIATPIITQNTSAKGLFMLAYSGVITPVFEELVFRGYIWRRLEEAFKSRLAVLAVSALLFALWHLGYADSLVMRVGSGALANVLFWKAVTGLFFGAATGIARMLCKNCYSSMLAHGVLNIFLG